MPTSSSLDNLFDYSQSESFANYSTWRGLMHSYSTLKSESPAIKDVTRLSYLRKQIVWHYFKNFFLFPILFFKLLTPSFFKGKVNVWTNLKTIFITREFRPLRMALLSQVFFLYLVIQMGVLIFFNFATPTFAATYTWVQNSWSGGASTTLAATHPGNQTGWNKYSFASSTVTAGTTVTLAAVAASTTQTTQADFNQGTFSTVTSTSDGDVTLSGVFSAVNDWSTNDLGSPTTSAYQNGGIVIRDASEDYIYVLPGGGSASFYRYSISGNSWSQLTSAPGSIGVGAQMIRNGTDNDIYVLRGNTQTSFYKYSISDNSWAILTSVPGTVGYGANMIRNGTDNDIYVLRGGSQTSFYKYSISGNSWTTLTVVPGTVGYGANMIRNATDDEIYVLRGNSTNGFYKYSISGNSWTNLATTTLTTNLSIGTQMIRNGSDDEIYVTQGNGTQASNRSFYKYSISGNTWTALTSIPGTSTSHTTGLLRDGSSDYIYAVVNVSNSSAFRRYSVISNTWTTLGTIPTDLTGASVLRIGSENTIYVFSPNGGFARYSISGNSWSGGDVASTASIPGAVGPGRVMIRNGSDNDIYVLRGNTQTSFYKYSISGNSWTTLTAVPGTVDAGGSMIRNGSDNDIYVLRGNSTNGFYKYSISGNSWTTLTVVPGTVDDGGKMIRNAADDEIYVLRGNSTNNLYKYSISGNSWTTLASAPTTTSVGAQMIRDGNSDFIYILQGGTGTKTGFYRYSISGDSWTTLTSVPATVSGGSAMIRNGSDNDIYLVTGNLNTGFYKYSISGNSWTTLTAVPGTVYSGYGTTMARHGSDNFIYLVPNITGNTPPLYRYSISGNSWTLVDSAPSGSTSGGGTVMLLSDDATDLYIAEGVSGTGFFRYIFNSVVYSSPGTFTSSVIDTSGAASFTTFSFSTTTPSNTTLTVDVRAGNTASPDGTWTAWQTSVANGGSISELGAKRYVQYRVNLATTDTGSTPTFSDILFGYTQYTSGIFTSSPYNSTDATNVVGSIAWSATTPTSTSVKFQVRTSADNNTYSNWVGPDGTANTYFTDATGAQDMPTEFNDSLNDQWMQYRAFLTGSGSDTPTLSGVTLSYVVNAPPDILIVTSTPLSESSVGAVSLTYQVRDLDTVSGATPGFVSVDLQYCTANCSSVGNEVWATAATSSLTGTFGPGVAVGGASYNTYSLIWDPSVEYANHYNGTDFKIRLRANDSEAANNIGTVESDTFVLDTKDPIVTVGIDGRSNAPYNLTISATDDTSAGLQMKLSNNSDLSSDGINGSSGTWIPYSATSTWNLGSDGTTIYYQVRDAYGNVSAGGAISSAQTPAIPAQIVYRDVSNADTNEWREFIAWGIIADPTPGFDHYTVWRSTDGTTYTILTTQSDRLINYYLDDSLNTDTTYYYKVTAEDGDGNVSNYSNSVNDKPNGQGGSDVTPPTISNVTSTAVGTQGATITWDTDELSDSLVDYIVEQGGDFSNTETVGLTAVADNDLGLGHHSVVLTGLEPNTTYYFRVRSSDSSDNEGVETLDPDGYSFTTLLGPSISDVSATDITNNTTVIGWSTDQSSDSFVHYSDDPSFGTSTAVGHADSVTTHSVMLTGLTPGTTYYYYVTSGIADDKHVVGGEIIYYSFTTTEDVDAPVITFDPEEDVSASDTTITLSWVTDEVATSSVEYGTSEDYGSRITNNNFNTDHSFRIESLLPGTNYYFRIKSTDINHNISSATEFTALTVDTRDYDAPVITDVHSSVVTDDNALIEWTTDEGATGQVFYGTAPGVYDHSSGVVPSYNEAHAVTLDTLATSTQYYYMVASSDASDNTATSTEYTFTTLETLSEESEVQLREEQAAADARAAGYAEGAASGQVRRSGGGSSVSLDRTAPIIRNLSVTEITGSSALFTWESDEAGDSIVEFGVDTGYGRASVDLSDSAAHRISLIKLDPNTTYYYRVSTADSSGNRSKFVEGTFETLSALEDISSLPTDTEAKGEEAEKLFVASIQKASEIIRSMSSQVSVSVLESTLLEQTQVIEELSKSLPLPIIGGQPVVDTGSNYATISWTTDKLSNSLVEYASADQYLLTNAYTQTVGNFDISTNEHSVEIKEVRPNTLYHYRVVSRTPTGAETKSRDFTFKTKNEFSEIGNYKAEVLSPEEASFFWVTNLSSNSQVSYTPYRNGVPDIEARKVIKKDTFTTEHLIAVTNLESGVLYDVELFGVDFGGNTVSKTIKGFSTDDKDLPPVIYQVQTDSAIIPGGKDKIQVIISWTTNELSTSRVLYRKGFASDGSEFSDSTTLDPGFVKKHIVVVSNFEPGMVYQFMVESTDSGGNVATSKPITILTPRKEQSVFQVIMSNVEGMFSWVGKINK